MVRESRSSPAAALPGNETKRLAKLRSLDILDSEAEDGFDALVRCAARLAACPIALISLVDDTRIWFKAAQGVHLRETPRPAAFCSQAIESEGLLEVADARDDARFASHPLVRGAPQVCFYAGHPLTLDGFALGTLCVMDTQPRSLGPEQRDALQSLARVATEMFISRQRLAEIDFERLRLLDFALASGDWMWETDAELRYTWVSGSFEAVTGLPGSSVRGRPIPDAPLLDDLGHPIGDGQTLHALLCQQQPVTRAIIDMHTRYGIRQFSLSGAPVFDIGNRFAGFRGTARDVSAAIAAARKTDAQAELLRKLSSQVPGVIFQFRRGADGRVGYTYTSDAAREFFGVEPPRDGDEADPTVPFRLLHPDDHEGYMASILRSSATLTPWQREYRIVRDSGLPRWLETRATPERLPDGSTLWHGFTADITERKEIELALRRSEERWSLAAEAGNIGVAQLDLSSSTIALDRRACANHGLPYPQNNYALQDWLLAVHPEDRAGIEAAIHQAISTRGTLEVRYRLQRPDGALPMLELVACCTFDDGHEVNGVVGTCRDVTQQLAHEQLRRDKETAERANRAKSEFLSRVSHELRTPLNGILGFAQLMALDRVHPLAADQSRRLESVLHAGRHLLGLVNDVLNLARIEQEDFSLQRAPVDLSAALRASLGLIQPLAESSGIRLPAPAATPVRVQADPRAVEQVLLNLLSNAIKYNRPNGQVRLEVRVEAARVAIAVSDEGPGLTPQQQAQLFQPFHRLGTEQRRVEGSGLGLVIARQLAAAMHGELRVESRVGTGSTFTLVLPATDEPAGTVQPEPPQGAAAAPAFRQVLYIEDEPLNVLLMQEVFKTRPHWQLQVAENGAAGLARARELRHDLLLIDMNLPDMSGLDIIRALRSDPATRGLYCIALSADALQQQIDAATAAGYDDYWTKPINVASVLNGLGQALD